jgi:hypothetical protein
VQGVGNVFEALDRDAGAAVFISLEAKKALHGEP